MSIQSPTEELLRWSLAQSVKRIDALEAENAKLQAQLDRSVDSIIDELFATHEADK